MRKVTIYTLLCFVALLFSAMTCDEDPYYQDVILENKSGETIYAYEESFNYDDTVTLNADDVFGRSSWRKYLQEIPADSSCIFEVRIPEDGPDFRTKLITSFDENSDRIQIIVFKQSTMDKYTVDEMAEKNIFDKRYVYLYGELEAMEFKLVYTGE